MHENNSVEPIEEHFEEIYRQNWENARYIRNERLWFTNIYAITVAAVLSFLHSVQGDQMLEFFLLTFLLIFSILGLLTSFRLKDELEECLDKISRILESLDVQDFVGMGRPQGVITKHIKFRWIFPLFYSITSLGFLALLIYRLLTSF